MKSAFFTLPRVRFSTFQAACPPESQRRPPAPPGAVLHFAGRGSSPASRVSLEPSRRRFVRVACDFFSFGVLLVAGRRNIVVTPGRAFRISLLVTLVLLCTLFCVIEPGTAELLRKSSFSILDASGEDVGKITATLAGGYGALSVKSPPLAAAALKNDVGWMPLVGFAERHLAALVMRSDALDDLHHSLLLLSPAVCSAGRC